MTVVIVMVFVDLVLSVCNVAMLPDITLLVTVPIDIDADKYFDAL